ncbi:MAG TPA: nuclear transport factor 2 family protein [Pyrinomonadaceae bacterium]|jgi:ketosteroid isomerase-like protein
MRRALILLTLTLLAFPQSAGQTGGRKSLREAKAERELRALVRQWDEANARGDAAALDGLLAEEFAFVGGPGKAEYLASVRNRPTDSRVESAVSDDVEVRVYGKTAVVTGVDTIKGSNKGQPYVSRWLYMDVWVRRGGRWQCVKTYSSPMRK